MMPIGSSLLRPTWLMLVWAVWLTIANRLTGNLSLRAPSFHCTSLFVVHTIMVQSRSKALSVVEAMSDSDPEKKQATTLAARRNTLATTLTCS